VWGWNSHSQKWELGVLRTPKNSELDCRGQNTSHWGVLYTVKKVLKCRCPKWPHRSHLDICNPSYGQMNGRESNWQFGSRPLKVGNRPDPDICRRNVAWCWKVLKERYKIASDLIPIRGLSKKLWMPKVPRLQPGTLWGLPLGSPRKKCHSDVAPAGSCREYYMGEGGGFPPSPGHGESNEFKVACGLSQHQKGAEWVLTNLWLVLDARPCNKIIVPLPSLIPGLLARPFYPL
jgi:hypothetical protein